MYQRPTAWCCSGVGAWSLVRCCTQVSSAAVRIFWRASGGVDLPSAGPKGDQSQPCEQASRDSTFEPSTMPCRWISPKWIAQGVCVFLAVSGGCEQGTRDASAQRGVFETRHSWELCSVSAH